MEVNGDLSILPKSEYKNVTCKDINIYKEKSELLGIVIIDGKIMHNNLHLMNKDEHWLESKLVNEGIRDITEVLLCTLNKEDKVIIYKKQFLILLKLLIV